ncbi:MAG: hypothetical protein ACC645_13565 [Pirellulales bacterium]
MAKVTIGWCTYNHCWPKSVEKEFSSLFSEFALPPARLSDVLPKQPDHMWNDCPAYGHLVNRLFVVRSPFPITWQVADDNRTISTNIKNVPVPFSKAFFDYSKIASQQKLLGLPTDQLPDHPIFDFRMHTLFVSNRKNTWADLMPAFLHDTTEINVLPIPGSFNVNTWPRPTVFAGPVLDKTKPVVLQRGDPLYYMRFRTDDPEDAFELKEIDYSAKLHRAVTARVNLKNIFPRYSWRLMHELSGRRWFDDTSE